MVPALLRVPLLTPIAQEALAQATESAAAAKVRNFLKLWQDIKFMWLIFSNHPLFLPKFFTHGEN